MYPFKFTSHLWDFKFSWQWGWWWCSSGFWRHVDSLVDANAPSSGLKLSEMLASTDESTRCQNPEQQHCITSVWVFITGCSENNFLVRIKLPHLCAAECPLNPLINLKDLIYFDFQKPWCISGFVLCFYYVHFPHPPVKPARLEKIWYSELDLTTSDLVAGCCVRNA
jgi:hypothetical protein